MMPDAKAKSFGLQQGSKQKESGSIHQYVTRFVTRSEHRCRPKDDALVGFVPVGTYSRFHF